MRKTLRPRIRRVAAAKFVSVSMAVGLVAAACGGSADTATEGSNDSGTEPAATESTAPATQEPTTSADGDNAPADADGGAEETAAPAENLFPDVDVTNVVDGSAVNLTSLGGGDRPVLLWFWAPH